MGKRTVRLAGIALGLTAAGLIVYLGRVAPTHQVQQTATPPGFDQKQHEAKMLAAALKQKPDHTPLLFRLAQLAEEQGKPAEAATHLREILRHEPANTEAQLELGKVLFESGDAAGSVAQTKAILARNPDHPDALYNLGAIYANLRNTSLAREYWTRLIASHPNGESAQRARTMLAQLN